MNQNVETLLKNVSQELRILETARKRYAKQLATDFSIFNYISTDEMMLSRIIADLLNPQGDHAQGTSFLELFLAQLSNAPTYKQLDLTQAEVSTEVKTFRNNTQRRMDIYIQIPFADHTDKFGICIENKPYAADQKNQLADYAKEISQRHKNNKWHIIYLTGNNNDPSPISISLNQFTELQSQNFFTKLSYLQLVEWLNHCKSKSINEKVNSFLTAFIIFITKQFSGIEDMSEQQSLLNLISANDDYIKATFEIIAAKDKIQDQLVKEFEIQLINACKKKNWYVNGSFSRDKATGLNICFEQPHQHINYIVQFYANNYGDFFWGLSRKEATFKAPELWIEIFQIMTETFSTDKVKKSEWWPYYIDQKYPFNWQSHSEVWSMIRSGTLCSTVMDYAEKTYQALKEHGLLERL